MFYFIKLFDTGEVELELERVLLERSDVHDSMAKAESATAALENDKKRLMDDVRRVSRNWCRKEYLEDTHL